MVTLELAEQRRERGNCLGSSARTELTQHVGELALRASACAPPVSRSVTAWAAREHTRSGAPGADRFAINPRRGRAGEPAGSAAGPAAGGCPLAADADRSAVGDRRDPLALCAVRAVWGRVRCAASADRRPLVVVVAAAPLAADRLVRD